MNEMKKRQQNLLMEALKAQAIKTKAELAHADAVHRGAKAAYRDYLRHEIVEPLLHAKFGYEESVCVRVTESESAPLAGLYRFRNFSVSVEFDDDMEHWIPVDSLSLNKDGTEKQYARQRRHFNPDFLLRLTQVVEPPLRKPRSRGKATRN